MSCVALGGGDGHLPEFRPAPTGEEMSTFRPIVRLMRQLDELLHTAAKKAANNDWFRRAAEEADLVLDSDIDLSRFAVLYLWNMVQVMLHSLQRKLYSKNNRIRMEYKNASHDTYGVLMVLDWRTNCNRSAHQSRRTLYLSLFLSLWSIIVPVAS